MPSVAVAVVANGRIVWEEGFGWADREKRIPADEHSMYSLASISKPITATGLMILAERGAIDLDKPANDYLGAAKLRAKIGNVDDATVRAVASHTAGLPLHYQFFYEDEPWQVPTRDETITRYGFLATAPGERHVYSNLGYGVLDYIIERVSQSSYAEFMRREVFQPLGLTRMSVDIGPGLAPYAAQRYGDDGAPIPFYTFDHPGGSAVYGSAHDLARFALFHLKARLPDQKKILTDASIDAMHRSMIDDGDGTNTGYGIGFSTAEKDGRRVVFHTGSMGGVSTRMFLFPDQNAAVIVLTNTSAPKPAWAIANHLVAALLPNWNVDWPEAAPPTKFVPPADMVGLWRGHMETYRQNVAATLEIRANGEIVAKFGDQIPSLVDQPTWRDGWLRGMLRARIGTPDTERFPYLVSLDLRRQGGELSGSATALDEDGPRTRNALSHWIQFTKN